MLCTMHQTGTSKYLFNSMPTLHCALSMMSKEKLPWKDLQGIFAASERSFQVKYTLESPWKAVKGSFQGGLSLWHHWRSIVYINHRQKCVIDAILYLLLWEWLLIDYSRGPFWALWSKHSLRTERWVKINDLPYIHSLTKSATFSIGIHAITWVTFWKSI
jgi:hypothetical protein